MKSKRTKGAAIAVVILTLAAASVIVKSQAGGRSAEKEEASSKTKSQPQSALELTSDQINSIKIAPVGTYNFSLDTETVGTISFADDHSVQVFPPFQGKIITGLVRLGDDVKEGQPLYTIDSPDLIQAESSLISAAGVYDLTTKELARARDLGRTYGVSEREREQATSDQQTAEGALRAARNAVRVFGKTDADIDQIIASRKVDPTLIVRSPIAGQITSFDAPPGLFVQPGSGTPPYTVTNLSVKWMLASVNEADIGLYRAGQPVTVRVMAYPDRVFQGDISKIYPSVDPTTHRATIRSEIHDPRNELRPGMLANFVIRVKKPAEALAIPSNGVVREGDGTMTAWVTTDRKHFSQRTIKIGLRSDGWVQVLAGLQRGELAVTDGAVFLSNMLQAPPSD